jgi:uncharacterized protein (DUF2147 family)
MKTLKTLISTLALAIASSAAIANNTPVGLWKTLADDGATPKSLVRVIDNGGSFSGRIEKLFDPAQQSAKCDTCPGARKGQPMQGLVLFENARADGADTWSGGEIIDPNTGKVFKLRLKAIDGGSKLEMRGSVGPLHRTQTWVRVE